MFKLHSPYKPTGDQPQAIEYLSKGIDQGKKFQTLLGVTGSGKTFTMANIINKVQKPTLVLAHNKTLAGQLYSEFKEFFPENNVEYFVSYYDYYQPESYIASSDTYIEKDASINDEIDKLRHSATLSLFETRDVIIVASVSCIYGLGDPVDYQEMMLSLRPGMNKSRDEVLKKLVIMQYTRNEIDFKRGTFRAKGDIVEIYPSSQSESAVRVEFWGDEIEKISEINPLTGKAIGERKHILIPPASQYVTSKDKLDKAIGTIEEELQERIKYFKDNNKLIEAQRIEERTNFDIEMMKETGFCQGIENYSRHLSQRPAGSPPYTLFDYFPKDFLLLIDESHATIPQVRAMYNGDRARKESLVKYGFRLPSAFDNRPLTFKEFEERINQIVFVGATPDGKDFAPVAAAKLGSGCVANVTGVAVEDGKIVYTSPVYAGAILNDAVCESDVEFAVLRSGAFKKAEPDEAKAGEIIAEPITCAADAIRAKVVDVVKEISETVNLEEADVIVAGGRGVGSAENFAILKELADALGGVIGATRAPIEAGWISRSVSQARALLPSFTSLAVSQVLHSMLQVSQVLTIS